MIHRIFKQNAFLGQSGHVWLAGSSRQGKILVLERACQAFFGRWPLVLDFQSGEVCRPTGKPLPMLLSICDSMKC